MPGLLHLVIKRKRSGIPITRKRCARGRTTFPWATAPSYLVRDNDRDYGHVLTSRVSGAMGIRDRPISPGSSWHNRYAERLIGTERRECGYWSLVRRTCGKFSMLMRHTTMR